MKVTNIFEKKVKEFAFLHSMFEDNEKIVLGVSGGADSVCLLKVLYKMNTNLVVVHVNHCIRGVEANEDERFVVDICKKLDIPCVVFRKKVEKIASDNKLTEEEAGRMVRYDSFRQVMAEYGASKIAVAHNMNDNAETILFNLCRGSGMAGLGGIKPVNGEIIRPLLCVTRTEIEEYLGECDVSYKTDKTNFLEEYTRNKLRLVCLPFLEENINKQVVKHMYDMSSMARQTEDFMNDYVEKLYKSVVSVEDDTYCIDINLISNEKKIIQKKLVRYVINCIISRLKDIEAVHIEDIVGLIDKQVGKEIMLPYELVAFRSYSSIKIMKKHKMIKDCFICEDVDYNKKYYIEYLDAYLTFRIIEYKKDCKIPKNNYTKWFDYDKINNVIKLRNRSQGDYIQLNSTGSKKKLKEFFIDSKIDKNIRGNIPLLADESHIMWVIGIRSSEGYRVDENTKRILEVCLINRTEA